MSDRQPIKASEPTHDEIVRAAYAFGYESGVKDGAERADQWASNKYGMPEGDDAAGWVMKLLPATRDQLSKRMR